MAWKFIKFIVMISLVILLVGCTVDNGEQNGGKNDLTEQKETELSKTNVTTTNSLENESGYELWLRYHPILDPSIRDLYHNVISEVVLGGESVIIDSVRKELDRGLSGLLDQKVAFSDRVSKSGSVVVGSLKDSDTIKQLDWADELNGIGSEGFIIRSDRISGNDVTVIAGGSDRGTLYGVFAFLRLMQTHKDISNLNIVESPAVEFRLMNHWDNWDRSIERGYAGNSLWNWPKLPDTVDPRYEDYVRAVASIGLNGSVINNVNANVNFIKTENLPKVAALAEVFKRYGLNIYLSIRYDSPMELGGLKTADPVDPEVIQWWKEKFDEIYELIPNFGGVLVKGDSEGQPGPLRYGQDHAVGANMLAELLEPHGGIVMWRAFVYGINGLSSDRVKQAYEVFEPLDGKFAGNVIVQSKNGPLDFQVREPVAPLFGALEQTNLGMELQITQEYTGKSTHLTWLVPQWKEVLEFDTQVRGERTYVKDIVGGSTFEYKHTLMTGVANTGTDTNWTRLLMAQANWYGFGRLAWNPNLTSEEIADEWTRMTYGNQDSIVNTISDMLLNSWEIYESYTSPFGLNVMIGPDRLNPIPALRQNYHHANSTGIGYDRSRSGNSYVDQYAPEVADMYNDLTTMPEELLLFFHHVPYGHMMKSGKTLIQSIYDSYYQGVEDVEAMISKWETLEGQVDPARYESVLKSLGEQLQNATSWRDICVAYFSEVSGITPEQFNK